MNEELLMICCNCEWIGHIFDCNAKIEESQIRCPVCGCLVKNLYEKQAAERLGEK